MTLLIYFDQNSGKEIIYRFCLLAACSTDNSIQHGVILFLYNDTYAINDSVRINCSAGYNATDDGFITCLSDGNWSKTTCVPIGLYMLYGCSF